MLSRRSVRIKAMQLLFSVNRDQELDLKEATKRYWASIEDTFNLFLLNLYTLVEVTKLASVDKEKRAAKHLPSDYDKTFDDKLFQNQLVQSLLKNKSFTLRIKKLPSYDTISDDYFQKIYLEFAKTEEYRSYIQKPSVEKDHLAILLELYRFCRKNELFNEIMEDNYATWYDDKSVVVGAVKKCLKELLSGEEDLYKSYFPSDETVNDFGYQLLEKTLTSDDELLEYIRPTLKNWDSERLAVIDMILLKMAICELIHFPSIPTKVSINEYVEVAKNYSTAKSKDFINGILDRLMKDLEEGGLINKKGRGLDD